MVPAIDKICLMDSKTLLDQCFILQLPLPLFFGITSVAEVVAKLVLQSEPLHVLTVHGKVI
jgi:hypothetical protein